jgi:anti-sigma B factor antagonist
MQLTVDKVGDVAVVTVNVVEFDGSNADDFKQEVAPVLEACARLVLDLNRVQFVDSSGCGAILSCLKRATAAGGDLKLCNVSRPVRTVFELIRLHRICEILDSREAAVRAFHAGGAAPSA